MRDRLHFLNIAESLLAEVGYCIHVASRLGYISEALAAELEADVRGATAPLVGLVRSTRATLGGLYVVIGAGLGAAGAYVWTCFGA